MSSVGQIAGGIIGGIAGTVIPGVGTWLGAQVGMTLGGIISPPKGPKVEGPRISDLSVQSSTYGASIARVYGTCIIAGNLIWVENGQLKVVIKKKKSGGKGGPKTTTKTPVYYSTFAVGLCEGPIAGVMRIWIGPNLIYHAGSTDTATIQASNAAATGFRIYNGTDTQEPDPRIQATIGVDNTPAWRGLAYIVFDDLPLEKYGNTLQGAQVRVEVMQLGVTYTYPYQTFSMPSDNIWQKIGFDGSVYCTTALFSHVVAVSSDGLSWQQYSLPDSASLRKGVASDGDGTLLCYGVSPTGSIWRSINQGVSWTKVLLDWVTVTDIKWNGSYFLATTASGPFYTSANGVTWTSQTAPPGAYFSDTPVWHADSGHWYVVGQSGAHPTIYRSATATTGSWSLVHTMGGDLNNFSQGCVHKGRILYIGAGTGGSGYGDMIVWSDDGTTWSQLNVPTRGYWILSDDENVWVGDGGVVGTCYYSPDGISNWTYYDGPNQGINHMGFYANFLLIAVPLGTGQGFRITKQSSGALPVELGEIVSTECLRSGILTAGDIDVTSLTQQVRGYRIGSRATIRSAIEPPQAAWPFDVVPSGYKIIFKARGGSAVATVSASDLGAHTDDDIPVSITASREMDTQLPRKIALQYLDVDRDQERGEQFAERGNTAATNTIARELPISLTATEAAGMAEVLLYLAWLERWQISFNLPLSYNQLEPGDIINLPTSEGTASVRLTSVNYTSDDRLECKGRYNQTAVYTPTAVGAPSASVPTQTIPLIGKSIYYLLDIPNMDDVQDDPGFVAAMYGENAGWGGGVLIRTDDGGTTWSDIELFAPPGADVGFAENTIGSVDSRMWDKASSLRVRAVNGDFSSTTELAVLNGANYFAYGDAGRWEIIAAINCTLVAPNTYVFTDMLRGRFGTEWAMSTHAVDDKVILLDTDAMYFIGMHVSTIGLQREYRGITYNQSVDSDIDYSFTYNGVNLECLSPVYFVGGRNIVTSDWSFSWVRRSRTDGEWRDSVDAGLGEASEAYELDVYSDDTYSVVKRTISSTSPACTYGSAEQVSDFGSIQSLIYAKLYQLSSVVGRGYPTTGQFISPTVYFYFSYVVFQAQMGASIGSTAFDDTKGNTISTFGDTKHAIANGLRGSSAYFDGTGDKLSLSATSDFNLASGAMTIEFWLYRGTNTTDCRVLQFGPNGSSSSCQVNFRSDGGIWFFEATGSPVCGFSIGAGSYALNQWNHVAIVLASSTSAACYINGVSKFNGAITAFPSTTYSLAIGEDSGQALLGNISGLRITKGVARYTGAFTPPTSPYEEGSADPHWSSVVLSMPLLDNLLDTKGKTVTVTGNTVISSNRYPFSVSGYFDGSGDYLTVPTVSADLDFGSDDFSIELWFNRTIDMSSGTYRLVNEWNGSTGYIFAVINNNLVFSFNNGSSYSITGPATTINTWHYATVQKSGNTVFVGIDAVATSGSVSGSVPTPVGTTYIGRASDGASQYFTGYIGPIRIVKGISAALFPEPNLPLPTQNPDTYWSQVALSIPMTGVSNGTVFRDYKAHTVTTVGNAKTSTSQYVGTMGSSGLFDGTNSQLTVPASPDFDFGTGDFCIEAWVRIAANSAQDLSGYRTALIASVDNGTTAKLEFTITGNSSTTGTGLLLGLDPGSGFVYTLVTTSISQGAWHLIEVNRESGTVRFFIDGLNVGGGGSFTHSVGSSTNELHIGGRAWASNYKFWLNGNIGPLRITKGNARHSSDYTVVQGPFSAFKE